VIQAFRLVRRHTPCRLVLAGGEATDDPEGPEILAQVQEAARANRTSRSCCCPPMRTMRSTPCSGRQTSSCKSPPARASALQLPRLCEGETGHRRCRGGHCPAASRLPHRISGSLTRRLCVSHPPPAAPPGDGPPHGPHGPGVRPDHFLITRHIRDFLTMMILLDNPDSRLIEL